MNVLSSVISILAVISFCYISTFSKTKKEYTGLALMAVSVVLGIIMRLVLSNGLEWVAGLLGLIGCFLFLNSFISRNTKKNISMIQYLSMMVLVVSFATDTIALFLER